MPRNNSKSLGNKRKGKMLPKKLAKKKRKTHSEVATRLTDNYK